jgi:hypothetical protein
MRAGAEPNQPIRAKRQIEAQTAALADLLAVESATLRNIQEIQAELTAQLVKRQATLEEPQQLERVEQAALAEAESIAAEQATLQDAAGRNFQAIDEAASGQFSKRRSTRGASGGGLKAKRRSNGLLPRIAPGSVQGGPESSHGAKEAPADACPLVNRRGDIQSTLQGEETVPSRRRLRTTRTGTTRCLGSGCKCCTRAGGPQRRPTQDLPGSRQAGSQ